jgi:hypothetical protein
MAHHFQKCEPLAFDWALGLASRFRLFHFALFSLALAQRYERQVQLDPLALDHFI